MDLKDYKRKAQSPVKVAPAKPLPAKPVVQTKSAINAAADEAWDLEDDDDNNGWGEDDLNDLKKFDYKNTDLNKMSDYQLQRHKQNMEQDFKKNVLKPGDKGFEYDKRVDYSSQLMDNKEDNSWDEDNNGDDYNEDDYFDDDFA